jgi:hypothetical protein
MQLTIPRVIPFAAFCMGVMLLAAFWSHRADVRSGAATHKSLIDPAARSARPQVIDIIDTHPLEGLKGSPYSSERLIAR